MTRNEESTKTAIQAINDRFDAIAAHLTRQDGTLSKIGASLNQITGRKQIIGPLIMIAAGLLGAAIEGHWL